MRIPLLLGLCILPLNIFAHMRVQLAPSIPSPQPVGTTVTWTATAKDTKAGLLTYRFSVVFGGNTQIARDYSQANTFPWTASVWEGSYQVQVTVRNNSTQETQTVGILYQLNSRVTGTSPVASPTNNPLVALFSAPPCASGSMMRVRFARSGGTSADFTNWRPCAPQLSMNFEIAGMRANTTYLLTAQVSANGVVQNGATISFQTGTPTVTFTNITVPSPAIPQDSVIDHVLVTDWLLQGTPAGFPTATDLAGNVIWYYGAFADPSQVGALLARVVPGGTMLVLADGPNSSSSTTQVQILREIDLAGNPLRETNATRVQEQLIAMGRQSSCTMGSTVCEFGAFHHEAIRLANGHTMVFGDEERIFPQGTQPNPPNTTGPVDIIGDMIVELDQNFQVVWSWSSFDHSNGGGELDITRPAVLGETCVPGQGGCPPLFLASIANDWLHGNSLQYRTTDGNLIMSIRHQDWVIKIDYAGGTGNILWRLGNQGDFAISSSDPWPWFSHQHDAGFESNGVMTVFDDGNTRLAQNPGVTEHSRGQAYTIDEVGKTATPVLNADLGVYSFALGSAQLLSNGNYHFLPGINTGPSGNYSLSIEVLPSGALTFMEQGSTAAYRSFRMPNLYTPPTT